MRFNISRFKFPCNEQRERNQQPKISELFVEQSKQTNKREQHQFGANWCIKSSISSFLCCCFRQKFVKCFLYLTKVIVLWKYGYAITTANGKWYSLQMQYLKAHQSESSYLCLCNAFTHKHISVLEWRLKLRNKQRKKRM